MWPIASVWTKRNSKKDDEIIQQFGDYTYGWHDSDAAGEAAKRGIDRIISHLRQKMAAAQQELC